MVQRRYVTILLLLGVLVKRMITSLRRAHSPIRRSYLPNGVEGVLGNPSRRQHAPPPALYELRTPQRSASPPRWGRSRSSRWWLCSGRTLVGDRRSSYL